MTDKKAQKKKRYSYKGHRLKWPKSLYVEWWRYAKLVDSNIGSFEEWFDAEKYAEPMQDDDVKVSQQKKNKLVLEIDLSHDFKRIMFAIYKIIIKRKDRYDERSYAKVKPSKSAKNFTPQTSKQRRQVYLKKQKGIKNLEIAEQLGLITKEVYDWKILSKGLSSHNPDPNTIKKLEKLQAIIAKQNNKKRVDPEDLYANAERTTQRHNAECKKILANVKEGVFP